MYAPMPTLQDRFDTALKQPDVNAALTNLARELKTEGMLQAELHDAFQHQLGRHMTAREDARFQSIAQVMDAIAGHCERGQWLFEKRL